jgi:hypothetical protein
MNVHKKSPTLTFTHWVSHYRLHSTPSWPVLLCKIFWQGSGHSQKILLRNSGQYDALCNLSNCRI